MQITKLCKFETTNSALQIFHLSTGLCPKSVASELKMSDLFKNIPLFRNKPFGTPAKADELRGKVVALYFGAKEVDPVLINKMKDFYNAGNALGFEVSTFTNFVS